MSSQAQDVVKGFGEALVNVQRARAALDDARDRVAGVLGAKPSEIIFTSGGTESNCLAIFGTTLLLRHKGRHIISSAVEHHAVLQSFEYLARKEGYELTVLPVDSEGRVSTDSLARALRKDTILVAVQAANNEIGTIQPVAALGALCREKGVVFHTDAVQWFGKEAVSGFAQFNADLVSVCAHKFHGPKGAGLLYIRSPLLHERILFGGAHENERRAGTANLAAIMDTIKTSQCSDTKASCENSPVDEENNTILCFVKFRIELAFKLIHNYFIQHLIRNDFSSHQNLLCV